MLPAEAVTEFTALYKKNFGKELTFDEASELANKVFIFFKTVLKPAPKEDIYGKSKQQ